MKKLLILLILCLFTFAAGMGFAAGPYAKSDANAGANLCKLTGPPWVPASIPTQPDGSFKLDVANALPGLNSLTAQACVTDPLWGELCASAVPLSFTRPSGPAPFKNIVLVPGPS